VVVTPAAFKDSLVHGAPPDGIAGPLAGLWWAARGDWDKAHKIVQDDEGKDAAWVHAYLHRVEGDLPNAGYWYRAAGKPVFSAPFDAEWNGIVSALLRAGS
jgi:hypothetical protein